MNGEKTPCGRVKIDNNDTENDIRPSAVGKKNGLFVGGPDADKRAEWDRHEWHVLMTDSPNSTTPISPPPI